MKTQSFFIKKNIFFIVGFSFLFFFFFNFSVFGTEVGLQKIDKGKTAMINKHTVCKRVTNNCDLSILVPLNTASEWTSFRNNYPSCVKTANCAIGDPDDPPASSNIKVIQLKSSTKTCQDVCLSDSIYKFCVSGGWNTSGTNGEWRENIWKYSQAPSNPDIACAGSDVPGRDKITEEFLLGCQFNTIRYECKEYPMQGGKITYKNGIAYCRCSKYEI